MSANTISWLNWMFFRCDICQMVIFLWNLYNFFWAIRMKLSWLVCDSFNPVPCHQTLNIQYHNNVCFKGWWTGQIPFVVYLQNPLKATIWYGGDSLANTIFLESIEHWTWLFLEFYLNRRLTRPIYCKTSYGGPLKVCIWCWGDSFANTIFLKSIERDYF